jgi:hypothetical protein
VSQTLQALLWLKPEFFVQPLLLIPSLLPIRLAKSFRHSICQPRHLPATLTAGASSYVSCAIVDAFAATFEPCGRGLDRSLNA